MTEPNEPNYERQGLPTHLEWLTFAGLAEVRGGMLDRMFRQSVATVAADLFNAPDIGTAREISITIKCKPMGIDDRQELAGVACGVIVKHKTPGREAVIALEVREMRDDNNRFKGRGLAYNPDSPGQPNQPGLFD